MPADQRELTHPVGRALGRLKTGLFETDLRHRIELINDYGAQLAGFENAAALLAAGVNTTQMFVDPGDHERILAALESDGTLDGSICRMRDVHGKLKWIEIAVDSLHDETGQPKGFCGVFRDLTPRREAEHARERLHAELLEAMQRLEESEQLVRQKNEQLETRNRDLRDYSAAVTHDLRAPLVAVKGFAEMLVDLYRKKLDKRATRLLRRIQINVEQMDRIIRGLQDLVLSGEQSEPRSEVDPARVMDVVLDNRESQIEDIGVRVEVQPEMPRLRGHPTKLYQLFDNLLSNALKHLNCTADPRARFGCETTGGGLRGSTVFFFEDNGPGIAEDDRERVFELFYRCDRTRPGVGLGLCIVRRLVEFYRGRIWVECAKGGGARFCFTLPDCLPPAGAGVEASQPPR